jgi:hypothetical protein
MLSAQVLHVAVVRCSQVGSREYRSDVSEEDLRATRALCWERSDTVAPLICEASSGMCDYSGNSHGALIFSSLRL